MTEPWGIMEWLNANADNERAGRRYCGRCKAMVNAEIRQTEDVRQAVCTVCGQFIEDVSKQRS